MHILIELRKKLCQKQGNHTVLRGPRKTQQVLLCLPQFTHREAYPGLGSASVTNSHSAPSPLLYFPHLDLDLGFILLNPSGIDFCSFPICVGGYRFDYDLSLSSGLCEAMNRGSRRPYPTNIQHSTTPPRPRYVALRGRIEIGRTFRARDRPLLILRPAKYLGNNNINPRKWQTDHPSCRLIMRLSTQSAGSPVKANSSHTN